jgi:hypothetical protein
MGSNLPDWFKQPEGWATFDTEEVRIPGATKIILPKVFFVTGNLKKNHHLA